MQLPGLLIEIIGGGFTGYITNSLAIKMLFKNYGPFGGVIIKTRDQFIENISQLVERDIINARTMEKELTRPGFQEIFNKIIEDLLHNSLPNFCNNLVVNDIPGLNKSNINITNCLANDQDNLIKDSLTPLLKSITIEDLLSDKQVNNVAKQLLRCFINFLQESNLLEELLELLYAANSGKKVNDIFSLNAINEIKEQLSSLINRLPRELEHSFADDLDYLLEDLYCQGGLSTILNNSEQRLKSRLDQLLNSDNIENNKQNITRMLRLLIQNSGQELIAGIINNLFVFLKKIRTPITSLFGDRMEEKIIPFLEKQLPGLIADILSWINNNEDEINQMLNQAVKESLREEGGGSFNLKVGIKKAIYDYLQDKEMIDNSLTRAISHYLQNKTDIRSLSQELSLSLINYLQDKETRQVFIQLEKTGVFKPVEISRVIKEYLLSYLDRNNPQTINRLFASFINLVKGFNFTSYFENNLLPFFFNWLKTNFIFSHRLSDYLNQQLKQWFNNFSIKKMSYYLNKEDLLKLKPQLINYLENNQDDLLKKLNKRYQKHKNKTLYQLIPANNNNFIIKFSRQQISNLVSNLYNKIADKKINILLNNLIKPEKSPRKLSKSLFSLLKENLSTLLEGRIAATVSENLKKISDQDMQLLVEDFMGRELKPITFFGALLGSIAAFFLYILGQNYNINQLNLPLSAFIYGLIGYLTNIIAIKMVFRPYRAVKIGKYRLPLTPGIVSREKPRFARAMGEFINQELLNKHKVNRFFQERKNLLKKKFTGLMLEDDYRIIRKIIQNNNLRLTNKVLSGLYKQAEIFVQQLTTKLANLIPVILKSKQLQRNITEKIDHLPQYAGSYLYRSLSNPARAETLLKKQLASNWVRKKVRKTISRYLESYNTKLQRGIISHKLILSLKKKYQEIANLRVNEIISSQSISKLNNLLSDQFIKLLNNKASRRKLVNWINCNLINRMIQRKKIKDFYPEKLEQYLPVLTSALSEKGLELLGQEREAIKKIVINQISKSMGFWFAMGKIVDVETTLQQIVDNLLDQQLPTFLDNKQGELVNITSTLLARIGESNIAELTVDFQQAELERLIIDLVNQDGFQEKINEKTLPFLNTIATIKLNSLVKILSLNNTQNLQSSLEKEIKVIEKELACQLKAGQVSLEKPLSNLLLKISKKLLPSKGKSFVLKKNISEVQLINLLKKLSNTIFNNDLLLPYVEAFFIDLNTDIKTQGIAHYLELPEQKNKLQTLIEKLQRDKNLINQLKSNINKLINKFSEDLPILLENTASSFILDLTAQATLDSVELYFIDLLSTVDTSGITVKEIEAMDAARIEELFYSFAGNYLRKLEAYGWIGSLIGLLIVLLKSVI